MSSLGDEHRSRLAASRGKKMPSFRGKLLTACFHPFLKKIKKLSVGIRGTGFEHFEQQQQGRPCHLSPDQSPDGQPGQRCFQMPGG